MAKAATIAKEAGLSGLEFGLAIPGTVGGAVWANAGAHDSDIASVLVEAGVIGPDGTESALDPTGLGWPTATASSSTPRMAGRMW